MEKGFRNPEDFLGSKLIVSDVEKFTSSSAPISCYDSKRRRIYAPYHAAYSGFGEQASVFALSEIPVDDIGAAENYVLLESDVEFQGHKYNWPIDASSILYNGLVRIFFLGGADNYYFFDWSQEEHRIISEISPVLCRIGDAAPVPLTKDVYEGYLISKGYSGYNLLGDAHEHIISVAKPAWDGNLFYGAITSSLAQPVLFRCADGMTFEFLSSIPAIAKYECQVAALNGKIYAILRGVAGDNFWVADIGDWSFRPCGRLPMAETRPQIMPYDGHILIAFSQDDILPNKIRNGRNNVFMLYGEGENLSQYREVFHAIDEMGIVYYDIVNCDGELYVIWSNSERFPDKKVWGFLHGKDTLYCSKLTM
ncbi:MAG: hypothetical protein IJS15_01780 [Victivallales bacterium]|nr:hypothetical protein [Victivallales bacterium]